MTPRKEQGCLFTSRTSAYFIADISQEQLIHKEPFMTKNEEVQNFGNAPLSLDLERDLVIKGTNCVVTLQGREQNRKIIDPCLIINCLGCMFCEDAWYLDLGEKEQALKHCKYFWYSEMLPTHYPIFLLLDFWLFTISRKHPLIYLLVAFMFLWTPMLPSFTTPMFSENVFPTHFKLLEEAQFYFVCIYSGSTVPLLRKTTQTVPGSLLHGNTNNLNEEYEILKMRHAFKT